MRFIQFASIYGLQSTSVGAERKRLINWVLCVQNLFNVALISLMYCFVSSIPRGVVRPAAVICLVCVVSALPGPLLLCLDKPFFSMCDASCVVMSFWDVVSNMKRYFARAAEWMCSYCACLWIWQNTVFFALPDLFSCSVMKRCFKTTVSSYRMFHFTVVFTWYKKKKKKRFSCCCNFHLT